MIRLILFHGFISGINQTAYTAIQLRRDFSHINKQK
jgi:hypothetical protein